MPVTGSALAGAVLGIGQSIFGAVQASKAKRELEHLAPPFYKVQDEYLQNRNNAEALAGVGTPAATRNYETTEAQRGLGSSLAAMLQGGTDPNAIQRVLDTYNGSINKTAAEDAEAHLGNIRYLMGVNKDLAGQKTMQWAINDLTPYERKLKEITERRNAGNQNIFGGAQTAVGAASAYATGKQNDALINAIKGSNNPGGNGADWSNLTLTPIHHLDAAQPSYITNGPVSTNSGFVDGGDSSSFDSIPEIFLKR